MKNHTTVAASRIDPASFLVRKFSNCDYEFNCLRRTNPELEQLSPFALFLIEHTPQCVAGNYPAFHRENRVRCYNGKTEADMLRADPTKQRIASNGKTIAENIIKRYDLEKTPCVISDWRFSVIQPGQSDTEYWNREADLIGRRGVVRVEIGNSVFEVQS
jgi:hypothetical protein